ncbi:CoA transferase [Cnuibacter sp. UC19_7]|uniref:CoA transferase n=1 Tax=Cnuibacter sp. UC19_7 TaxID=3350166 RepID=UPI0036713D45
MLGVAEDHDAVATAVAALPAGQLESALVEAGGAAAVMRSAEEWAAHPQGIAIAREPLAHIVAPSAQASGTRRPRSGRPLAGLRVLDLTRVLAGPTATQALAGWGADVLRIDPPEWDEPGVVPLVTSGKRTARLDARNPPRRERLHRLVREADILVHGYRPGAMESLGLDEDTRAALNPTVIDVQLDAYGHTGPWRHRRGFDSLVQMSAGIADTGMRDTGAAKPTPLPVQALDYATGWLAAAAAIRAIHRHREHHVGTRLRLSLARTARLLEDARAQAPAEPSGVQPTIPPSAPFATAWGDALLTEPPVAVGDIRLHWYRGPQPLGSDAAGWTHP